MTEVKSISGKQIGFLKGLCKELGKDEPDDYKNWTAREAGQFIEELLEEKNGKKPESREEPEQEKASICLPPGAVNQIRLGLAAKIVANNWTARDCPLPTKDGERKKIFAVEVLGMYEALCICEQAAEKKHKEATAGSGSASSRADDDYHAVMTYDPYDHDQAPSCRAGICDWCQCGFNRLRLLYPNIFVCGQCIWKNANDNRADSGYNEVTNHAFIEVAWRQRQAKA